MSEELGLSYWLARTQLSVTVEKRHAPEQNGKGSTRAAIDVAVEPGVASDPTGRQRLVLDSALLSDLSLTIDLDERGLIESVSTDPDRVTPRGPGADARVASPPSVAITCHVSVDDAAPPLTREQQWTRHNENLAGHAAQIETNIERLLNNLGHFDANPVMIAQSGEALEVLQAQLESIMTAKRAWMATTAHEQDRGVWHLTTADLVWVDDDELPLRVADPDLSASMRELAERFDVVVALADGQRPEPSTPSDCRAALVLRRSRPAQIGVYVRSESGDWLLQDGSTLELEVVDSFSQLDLIAVDGSWLRSTSFRLAFHADKSLKTFGIANRLRSKSAASNGTGDELAAPVKPRTRPRKATASAAPNGASGLVEQRNQDNQSPGGG